MFSKRSHAKGKLCSFLVLTYITFRAVVYRFWAIIAGIRHHAQLMSAYQYIIITRMCFKGKASWAARKKFIIDPSPCVLTIWGPTI